MPTKRPLAKKKAIILRNKKAARTRNRMNAWRKQRAEGAAAIRALPLEVRKSLIALGLAATGKDKKAIEPAALDLIYKVAQYGTPEDSST